MQVSPRELVVVTGLRRGDKFGPVDFQKRLVRERGELIPNVFEIKLQPVASTLSLRNREQVLRAAYNQQISGQRGSRQNRLANRILRKQFVLRSGLHHVDVAVLARDVQFAGGRDGRGDERSA